MTVDRSLFRDKFWSFPAWNCPTCKKGHLVVDKETMQVVETGPSRREHDHDAWSPEWIEKRFVALLKCNFGLCGEVVAIGGSVFVEDTINQDEDGTWHQDYVEVYRPKSLIPAPPPIQPVSGTPQKVSTALADAAGLIWQNSEAAANRIRQAVEHLMDSQKVKKQTVNSGKRTRLTLHARIEEFKKKDPVNAEILLAIKWIGNSGSHPHGLKRDNVLDAFDMMELVLSNVYGKSHKSIMDKVKAINKAKGPAKSKKK